MPPPRQPAASTPAGQTAACVACETGRKVKHTCSKVRPALGARYASVMQASLAGVDSPASVGTPRSADTPGGATTREPGSAGSADRFGPGARGGPGRPRPPATEAPRLAEVPRAAVAKLGEFAVTRAVSPLTVEAPPEDDGWVSRRHPRPKLDRSTAAKKARQLDSRLQQDDKALDPADLPPQLFAGTFVAQVELIQVVTEHARNCGGAFTPESRTCRTAGLAGTTEGGMKVHNFTGHG